MKKFLYFIILIMVIIILLLIYSRFIGIKGLTINENLIKSSNVSNSFDGVKIVHFSDIHYGKIITKDRIHEVIKNINILKPDIVLFTGDLIDNNSNLSIDDISFLIKELSLIESTYGNFSIIGDNDYKNIDVINNIYLQSNFTLLDNDGYFVYNEENDKIFIGGVSTSLYNKASIDDIFNEENDSTDYKIIMVHEGDYIKDIISKYKDIDLIVGGHSINGSINIIGIKNLLMPRGANTYYKPYYKIGNTEIYISNGIGVNNINFRFNNTPSINFYRIYSS